MVSKMKCQILISLRKEGNSQILCIMTSTSLTLMSINMVFTHHRAVLIHNDFKTEIASLCNNLVTFYNAVITYKNGVKNKNISTMMVYDKISFLMQLILIPI